MPTNWPRLAAPEAIGPFALSFLGDLAITSVKVADVTDPIANLA
jgi:hypothetical protein